VPFWHLLTLALGVATRLLPAFGSCFVALLTKLTCQLLGCEAVCPPGTVTAWLLLPLGLRFQDLQSLPYLTHYKLGEKLPAESDKKVMAKISKGSPYSITEHRVPELISVLGSQPAGFLLPFCGEIKLCINPAVGCHYFPPGLQLPPQPLRGLPPILLLGEQRHNGCELPA